MRNRADWLTLALLAGAIAFALALSSFSVHDYNQMKENAAYVRP